MHEFLYLQQHYVVKGTPHFPTLHVSLQEWIQEQVEKVRDQFADGINIDIEDPTQNGTNQSALLTQLVQDTYLAFKMANKSYQVTFDVAWSPNCIDGRCYQYKDIASSTDFVVIMAYDERSQIFGPCIASANSALPTTAAGIASYMSLGIPADKLVLGQPWYGYDYPCLTLTDEFICTIPKVPFRGVNCSDAAGTQRPYYIIRELIRNSTAFVQWNATLQAPFFHYRTKGGEQHQVWYDDTESLSLKYIYAAQQKLKGLAFWSVDYLDYSDTPRSKFLTEEMWETINVFLEV